jgi:hypothetical protein
MLRSIFGAEYLEHFYERISKMCPGQDIFDGGMHLIFPILEKWLVKVSIICAVAHNM